MRLLVVEDSRALAEGLAAVLRAAGYAVDVVHDGVSADAVLSTQSFDLVVLDLTLPEMDGLAVLRRLRAPQEPHLVLVLTARGALDERVHGLDLGADDYMTKPFDVRELEARVRMLLRRQAGLRQSSIEIGEVCFDTVSRTISARGETITLPARELAVFETLLLRSGSVVPKQAIIESLADFDEDLSENAVETYVSRLRRRIAPYGLVIRVARGLGYYLTPGEAG
ncbi:MAG: response regulator transcription factor [Devosia sp.]|nr:response regulator transcription factor [Devosia sp.]